MLKSRSPLSLMSLALISPAAFPASVVQHESAGSATRVSQTQTADNKAIVLAALNAWKEGDSQALPNLLSDDIVWTITGNSAASGSTHGMAELMTRVPGPFGARFNPASINRPTVSGRPSFMACMATAKR
jgi:uncharacterized protein